ncbi:hypothetical protein B0I35DRAFT_423149 [Stachybotrys elegans]|uniref:SET domain-containing protein n=1 Tax=Stachybotrys elegans TaxID=80388 RepID=A0A8K0SZ12_9HYPO|nr:hypothetical protein B0I35DRAFT_423149 [Stachybotrys elegans]
MANHSCIPNATVQFAGRYAILRADAPLQSGQEIEISYTDVTYPLSKRRDALDWYYFDCQCPRCLQDLNVYQAAALEPSTTLKLNEFSVVPSLASKIRNHPATKVPDIIATAQDAAEKLVHLITPQEDGEPAVLRAELQQKYTQCRPLVAHELWAVPPLSHILMDVTRYYSSQHAWSFALVVACLEATASNPYQYVPPFETPRVRVLYMIAKLLSNTAAECGGCPPTNKLKSLDAALTKEITAALWEIDQIALCQMLLIMVIKAAPAGYEAHWPMTTMAKTMLDEISILPGRNDEQSIINEWANSPGSERSRAFFEYAVVQPMERLSAFGRDVLRKEFGY